ncbi:hypothetical protein GT037_002842 [Alternaria burnsii]|uniref:Uncharacterized protein n=1 Tax=Alternaria burnsii TaxID=1187904 RepID=A0A8H7BC66_9PLEO|nr:uncharacterized protein GT037_002842 [Alternaria burnsii]KAF7679094.1 hypothetical protein GT037_002842 [Alternaria burnsii]
MGSFLVFPILKEDLDTRVTSHIHIVSLETTIERVSRRGQTQKLRLGITFKHIII